MTWERDPVYWVLEGAHKMIPERRFGLLNQIMWFHFKTRSEELSDSEESDGEGPLTPTHLGV